MRGDDVALRRGRGPISFAAVGAMLLTAGFLLLLASLVLQTADKHSFGSLTIAGALLAVAGVAFGVVTLTLFGLGKAITARRRSDHNDAGYPIQATSISPGTWPSVGQFSPSQFATSHHPDGQHFNGQFANGQHPDGQHFNGQFANGQHPDGQPGRQFPRPPVSRPNVWRPAPGPAPARPAAFTPVPSAPQANGYPSPPPGFGGGLASHNPGPHSGPARQQQPRPFVPQPPAAAERRAAPLDPTSVYSPGGLIGGPSRDGRRDDGPVTPGHEFDHDSRGKEQPDGPEYEDYAEVVHEEPRRPSRPPRDVPLMPMAPPEPAAMFVYRDPGDEEEKPRGPFEPLVKSAGEATLDDGATVAGDHPA